MEKPVVFLAFADSEGGGSEAAVKLGELNELGPEFDGIKDALDALPAVDMKFVQNVRAEKLIEKVGEDRHRIVVFHYAGHSDDGMMVIGGGGSAESLARTLKDCPNLRLVFLNGCGTISMTNALLEAGIPAVIATSGPIGDPKAKTFAIEFYKALGRFRQSAKGKPSKLGGHNSIEAAMAEANKQLTGDKSRAVGVVTYTRGAARPGGPDSGDIDGATPVSEWDLHVEDRRKKSWKNSLPWNWRVFERSARDWSVPVRLPPAALPLLGVLAPVVLLFQPLWFPTMASAIFPLFLTLAGFIVGWRLPLLKAQTFARVSCVGVAVLVLSFGISTLFYLRGPVLRLAFADSQAVDALKVLGTHTVTVEFAGDTRELKMSGGQEPPKGVAATLAAGHGWLVNVTQHSLDATLTAMHDDTTLFVHMKRVQTDWTRPFDLRNVTSIKATLGTLASRECSEARGTLDKASVGWLGLSGVITTCILLPT